MPADIHAALSRSLEGVSRSDLAVHAARLSETYRRAGSSAAAISSSKDALAYAVARMPATYAAVRSALENTARACPMLQPRSLLDLGSGPGTAAFAALDVWPGIQTITMIDSNPRFRELAAAITAHSGRNALVKADVLAADLWRGGKSWPAADLVVCSYVLVETNQARAQGLVLAALARAGQALVLVEPGTPAGFSRIEMARRAAIGEGAWIAAPCPHAQACPMPAPDWCHFSVRLARSRDHKLAKSADAPFEDERFSYVAASRGPAPTDRGARLISPPRVRKGDVVLRACGPDGISERRIPRRDKSEYKAAKHLGWGDVLRENTGRQPPPRDREQ